MLALMVTKLGHSAEACSEPTEAIQKHALGMLSGVYGLVICDYLMWPDGLKVLEEFVPTGAYRVLLTGSHLSHDMSRALAAGTIHEVLQKPVSLAELSRVLDCAQAAR